MATETEDLMVRQEDDGAQVAADYPKVNPAQAVDQPHADPVGSVPLSIDPREIPHHPGAAPAAATPEGEPAG